MELRSIGEITAEKPLVEINRTLGYTSNILRFVNSEFQKIDKLEFSLFQPKPNIQFGITLGINGLSSYQKTDRPATVVFIAKTFSNKSDILEGTQQTLTLLSIIADVMEKVKKKFGVGFELTTSFEDYNKSTSTITISKNFNN